MMPFAGVPILLTMLARCKACGKSADPPDVKPAMRGGVPL